MSLKQRWSNFRGLTLIEILIAMVITLIVLGAMMYAFRYASQEITKGRATMELSNQLLVVQDLLRSDLDGVTVDVRPWSKTASPNGYFEYIEGIGTDKNRLDQVNNLTLAPIPDGIVDANRPDGVMGDIDDVLAMTVRSRNRPFRGRFNGQMIESNVAEVIWWTTVDHVARNIPFDPSLPSDTNVDYDETVTLHRRVLLVRPDLAANLAPLLATNDFDKRQFFLLNDISVRPFDADGNGSRETMMPNSLEDLSKRENRFAHFSAPGATPFAYLQGSLLANFGLNQANVNAVDVATGTLRTIDPGIDTHVGDDVVISDVVGFDLQIFSPNTPLLADGGLIHEPDDVHYLPAAADFVTNPTTTTVTVAEQGAFVDLGYNWANFPAFDGTQPAFSTVPTFASGFENFIDPDIQIENDCPVINGRRYFVYDTFSTHYESDGIDQDLDGLVDEGTNGIDDDGANGVDDNNERETLPPYPNRALGFKATVRVVERGTKQVRQTEIIASFVPQ